MVLHREQVYIDNGSTEITALYRPWFNTQGIPLKGTLVGPRRRIP